MIPKFYRGRFVLDAGRPLSMGVVKLSENSFSGDGLHGNTEAVIARGRQLVATPTVLQAGEEY
ncbi:MAG: hypothetical protein FIA96_10745 [Betaproteobacteria bacterium]|nr:hypothetical protein [Betaproteobacteria bacterium]